jgi:hypothetical protein
MEHTMSSAGTLLFVGLRGEVQWRLPAGDVIPEFRVAHPAGYSLVNPLLVPTDDSDENMRGIGPLPDETILVSSSRLCVRIEEPRSIENPFSPVDYAAIERWLRQIRFLSRQFTVPRKASSYAWSHRTELGPRPTLELLPTKNLYMREYLIRTAVTLETLRSALALPGDYQVPLASEIMLDALEARTEQDDKRAILYAAIAAESALTRRLDEEYDNILKLGPGQERFRVVERMLAGGQKKREDPVYAAISETFKTLLHERSLYLLGHSILLDEEELYRQAVKLHKTRNLLAHGSEAESEPDVFSLDSGGAANALQVAARILEWTGDAGPYVVSDALTNPIDL